MRCVIVGAGGHGRVVLGILRATYRFDHYVFWDSDPNKCGTRVSGVRVVPFGEEYGDASVVAVGDNRERLRLADLCLKLTSAIHPSAQYMGDSLGQGTVLAAGSIVCVGATVGELAVVNTGAIVDHECTIGRAAHICPGARLAGRVTVGEGAFVGIGATVIQGVTIGPWATVGAGAVVIRDVEPNETVVGVPARALETSCESSGSCGHGNVCASR